MLIILLFLVIVAGLFHSLQYLREAEGSVPPAGSFMTVDGLRLHYLDLNAEARDKPPVVLVHGVSSNMLDMKLALGDALAEGRRVILFDRPGFGYSARDRGRTGMARQAALLDRLLEELGAEKPVIIAHSWGGALALRHTLDFPDRAGALILLAPVSHRWPGGVDWHNHAATLPLLGPLFAHVVPAAYGRLAGRKAVRRAFWPQAQPEGYFDKAGMALIFRPGAFTATAEDLVELYDEITLMEPHYSTISQPVRMLAGTHDTTVLSTIHCMGLERKVADTTLEYIPHVGHTVHHACLGRIRDLLDDLDAGRP